MQFTSWNERQLAVKKATEELGKAYGEIKFKEFMLKEVSQSFVKGETQLPPAVTEEPVEEVEAPAQEVKVEEKPAPKKKRTPAPKIKKEEPEVEEAPAPEVPEEEAQPEETEVQVPEENTEVESAEECPLTSTDDLRSFMTKRFKELGGNAGARESLVNALKESTGYGQAADVPDDKLPAAYAALSAL